MRPLRLGLLVMCMMFMLIGCGIGEDQVSEKTTEATSELKITEENASEILKSKLEEKYQTELIVENIQKKSGEYLTDKNPSYEASISLKQDNTKQFESQIYVSTGEVYDNFSKIIFNDALSEKITSILDNQRFLNDYDFRLMYKFSNENWNALDQMETYLEKSGTFVSLDLFVLEDYETLERDFFKLIDDLENAHFYYDIRLVKSNKEIFISHLINGNTPTKEEISSKLN